jgi:hypothetical protein
MHISKLGRKSKRGRKMGKCNSRKIERSSEKINKTQRIRGGWIEICPE